MQIIKTSIPEVLIFEPRVFQDNRGCFFESFRQDFFEKEVGKVEFVQDNQSLSYYGVLRGLHYQKPPFAQAKLVRCIEGEVLDVAVDIRPSSPTFGKHVAVVLSGKNTRQLWIPRGFAHGFVVLSPQAIFAYKCDNYYAPEYDGGIRWDDSDLGIDWRVRRENLCLSDKDIQLPAFRTVSDFK